MERIRVAKTTTRTTGESWKNEKKNYYENCNEAHLWKTGREGDVTQVVVHLLFPVLGPGARDSELEPARLRT